MENGNEGVDEWVKRGRRPQPHLCSLVCPDAQFWYVQKSELRRFHIGRQVPGLQTACHQSSTRSHHQICTRLCISSPSRLATTSFNLNRPGRRVVMEPCGEAGVSVSTEAVWEEVDNIDWADPSQQVITAFLVCDGIAKRKVSQLASDKEWLQLDESSKRGAVPGFGKKVSRLFERQRASYEDETASYDVGVRRLVRDSLGSGLMNIVQPAQEAVVEHCKTKALERLKRELEAIPADGVSTFAESVRQIKATVLAQFDGDYRDASISPQTMGEKTLAEMRASYIREQFLRNLDRHIALVQAQKLSQIVSQSEERLMEAIRASAASLPDAGRLYTWPSLRKLLSDECKRAVEEFAAELAGFELDEENETTLVSQLRAFGRKALREFTKGEAQFALNKMNYRFNSIFCWNGDEFKRTMTQAEDVRAIVKHARTEALKLLSVLAAIRLEDNSTDEIESALLTLFEDNQEASTSGRNTSAESTVSSLLAASSWDGVAPEDTLLTPVECRVIWNKFKSETEDRVNRDKRVQEIWRQDKSSFHRFRPSSFSCCFGQQHSTVIHRGD